MKRLPLRALTWLLRLAAMAGVVLATIVLLYAIQARVRLSDLKAWHRLELTHEFRAGRSGAPADFDGYRRLEDQLFAELRQRILDDPAQADTYLLGRYNPRSIPARLALETPWNRSFELIPEHPRGAVLLVHGLSDSPYSMRSVAQEFHALGYYVLGLRLPGHGTIPSALLDVDWEDWYASVVLAARHAAERAGPGGTFLAGGHSTGAALLTLYARRSLEDPSLPRPQRLYLMSPAIGVSRFAVLTNVVAGLSFLPYFEKSKWMDVYPEYDPYKYGSFPVNAANQIHNLTRVLHSAMLDGQERGLLEAMPRIVVFQSIVDATVTAADVVRGLLSLLPQKGHELVVFDVNRSEAMQGLIAAGPLEDLERLRNAVDVPFRLTLIGNRSASTNAIAAFWRDPGEHEVHVEELPLAWPRGVFSLGHVAVPVAPDDPVYGIEPRSEGQLRLELGALAPRGESGALIVPLGTLARLRSNPFFDVIRAKIKETLVGDASRSQ